MVTQLRKTFIKPSIALALVAISSLVSADTKQEIAEARQETQIWTTYALSPYLRANDIKVQVHDGKATLTGKVDENVNKDLAKQIALGVSGIKSVDNQIIVQADYNPKRADRGYAEVIEDATITAAVKSRLMWSKYSYSDANTVETKSGHVTLTGAADTAEARDFAGRLAMGTRGVASVSNQMVVSAKPNVANANKGNDTSTNIADGWITTKVKSNFVYSSNVASSDIEVNTSSGIVTLKGKVSSGAERALAIELAQNVRGVKSVEAKDLVI
jgi:hyperosmotically inducible periplasmic protein